MAWGNGLRLWSTRVFAHFARKISSPTCTRTNKIPTIMGQHGRQSSLFVPFRPFCSARRPFCSARRPICSACRAFDTPSRAICSARRPICSARRAFDTLSRAICSACRLQSSARRAFASGRRANRAARRAKRAECGFWRISTRVDLRTLTSERRISLPFRAL